ncbi:hypothetical protein COEREDRAFT_9941 [Coemansia reversa NRRL 1564]|uniref:Uncharacterized protein n=1 Tax=Coemansia reversa (strain ATCC 12441 / NRRL 1564) TaxID=763665 RepID=A0A2G5B816_COERN|nr:hypothetical protein COEREDRAFT_9941 [Coemansia reversa NRRL 1564]|eukprot:PIA14867.1 hypothetical protein COEREDRAFT_9941 [Coemansia reversa NRRL 1564]
MKSLLIAVQLVLCSWWVAALPAELELSPIRVDVQLKAPASELQTTEERTVIDLSASDDDVATSESAEEAEEETSEESIMAEVHAAASEPQGEPSESAEEAEDKTSEESIMPQTHAAAPESQDDASESAEEAEEETSEALIMPEVHAAAPESQGETSKSEVEEKGNGDNAQFVGLLPDAMFSAIQGETGHEDEKDEQQPATVDEEQLLQEAEELRSAEFVSDIVTAMEDGTAETEE